MGVLAAKDRNYEKFDVNFPNSGNFICKYGNKTRKPFNHQGKNFSDMI